MNKFLAVKGLLLTALLCMCFWRLGYMYGRDTYRAHCDAMLAIWRDR